LGCERKAACLVDSILSSFHLEMVPHANPKNDKGSERHTEIAK
jgi:hypothetical protein